MRYRDTWDTEFYYDREEANLRALEEMARWRPLLERLIFLINELEAIEEPEVFALYFTMVKEAEHTCDMEMRIGDRRDTFNQRVRDGHGDLAKIRDKAIKFGVV